MQVNRLCLTVSHNIFLTKNQRYKIGESDYTEIEAIGISMPVWCVASAIGFRKKCKTDEPGDEIFCKYYIDNKKANSVIDILEDGYRIHLTSDKMRTKLLDVKDMGGFGMQFTYNTNLKIADDRYRIIHFVGIEDLELLKESIVS